MPETNKTSNEFKEKSISMFYGIVVTAFYRYKYIFGIAPTDIVMGFVAFKHIKEFIEDNKMLYCLSIEKDEIKLFGMNVILDSLQDMVGNHFEYRFLYGRKKDY